MVHFIGNLFQRVLQAPSTAPGERVYAIGDLHGRLDLLRDILRRLNDDVDRRGRCPTRVVLLGDMIDRGPSSRQLVDFVRGLQSRTSTVVALCGNHEEMLLKSAEGNGTVQQVWVENGGDATLQSYGIDPVQFMQLEPQVRGRVLERTLGTDTLAWLNSLPLTYRSGDYFFCHAGVRPGVQLEHAKTGRSALDTNGIPPEQAASWRRDRTRSQRNLPSGGQKKSHQR